MITAIELENFKGIAGRQRIELRPLTLVFGPNNAGKSTLLHSFLYLHELVASGHADVGAVELGGEIVDLGGFDRLVHRHDRSRTMRLRVEFATPGLLDRFGRREPDYPLPDLEDEVEAAWLEFEVTWVDVPGFTGPLLSKVTCGANGERLPMLTLEFEPVDSASGGARTAKATLNLLHPLIVSRDEQHEFAPETWVDVAWESGAGADGADASFMFVAERPAALPPVTSPIRVVPASEGENTARALAQVRATLEMIIVGTGAQLLETLRASIYVGPLRSIPPRGFLYERSGRRSSWANGLGAWDELLAGADELLEGTNEKLRRLGAGCEVVRQILAPVPRGRARSRAPEQEGTRRLLLKTATDAFVLPSELGAGISQVIPVVVLAASPTARIALVEQPELHVHPALQVELGDLFIEATAAARWRRSFVLETHSEHLILRLLKRIRQTASGQLERPSVALTPGQLSVAYVEQVDGETRVRHIRVDELGEFIDRWPRGFFEERMEEVF